MEQREPQVGDIWCWHSDGDGEDWTVLLLRRIDKDNFEGIALEDGWRGSWGFRPQFGGELCGYWEYMA